MKIYSTLIIAILFIADANAETFNLNNVMNGSLTIIDDASKKEINLTKEQFEKLKHSTITTSTSWTPKSDFEGVKIQDILNTTGFKGKILRLYALNDYWVDIPIEDVIKYDIILADKMNGTKLKIRNFGPYFVIYPLDDNAEELNKPIYLARFIWQVYRMEVKQG